MIDLSKLEVPENPATGNDILIDSDILLGSDGKTRMQYVVSDTEPDVGGGTRGTMGVILTTSNKLRCCVTRIPL